jgi:PAS domain-containing protein
VPRARGEAGRVLGTSTDVTERRRIAEELRSLEILWGAMMASLPEHVAIIDRFGVLIAVNDAWSRFAGEGTEGRFERAPIGANYIEVCRRAGDDARRPRRGRITAVLTDLRPAFVWNRLFIPDALRWYEFSVVLRQEGGASCPPGHHAGSGPRSG